MTAASSYRAIAKRYRTLPEQVVRAGGKELQDSVLARLKADTGGDRKLSGFTRRPGRHSPMGVSVKVFGGVGFSEAEILPSPRKFFGMWSILESGTKERFVGQLKRKDGPGGKHMKIGGEWRTGPWSAGSSPAKHTYSEGIERGLAAANRAMTDVWERANG